MALRVWGGGRAQFVLSDMDNFGFLKSPDEPETAGNAAMTLFFANCRLSKQLTPSLSVLNPPRWTLGRNGSERPGKVLVDGIFSNTVR